MEEDMPIKVHLSKLLGERKLRASEVARKTGINKNTLSSLYNESISGIRFDTLEKLCKFLNCSIGDLIEYVPKKTGASTH
jgi:putative transcriptional regulator